MCCHVGGDMDFDAQGNLYVVTGDDSNPFSSDGYAPLDDRANRNPAFDAPPHLRQHERPARQGAADQGRRGRHLHVPGRQHVPARHDGHQARDLRDGLPQPVPLHGRQEDRATSTSASTARTPAPPNANRGPGGQVEFNLIKQPGNYGWPYCVGQEQDAYNDFDFATNTSGPKFNCAAPKNESRFNTGLTDLPAGRPGLDRLRRRLVPEFGSGSESPMGGPTYHFDAANPSTTKFPAFYDGKNFAYEFGRAWIKTFTGGTADLTFPRSTGSGLRLSSS